MIISLQFGQNPISGLGGDVVFVVSGYGCTDARTDPRTTDRMYHKSSHCHYDIYTFYFLF